MIVLKTYDIIERAVEEGIEFGWNRAHKHEDSPPKEVIIEHLVKNIMHSLDEIIDFSKIDKK